MEDESTAGLYHVELISPVHVENGREVDGIPVEEILLGVARDELVTEFKNLEKRSSTPTYHSLQPAR